VPGAAARVVEEKAGEARAMEVAVGLGAATAAEGKAEALEAPKGEGAPAVAVAGPEVAMV